MTTTAKWTWASWRLVLAGLTAILVAAAALGVGAWSSQIAVTPDPASPSPGLALDNGGTVTPTPRVIAVPEETMFPTPEPTRANIPDPADGPPPALPNTAEPPPLATATPTPWLMVADAPTATPRPRATIVPSTSPTPTLAPSPLPTRAPPSPTITPTSVPSRGVQLAFGAADWVGGFYRGDGQAYGRPWTAVYGSASAYPRAALAFALDVAPVESATVTIAGLDDEWAARNEIALEVNGQAVFSGPSPFADWDGVGDGRDAVWTSVQFTIPAGRLGAGRNEIAVANLTPASNFNAPPYVLVSDVTLVLARGDGADAPLVSEPDNGGKKEKPQAARGQKKQKDWKDKPANDRGDKKGQKKRKRR